MIQMTLNEIGDKLLYVPYKAILTPKDSDLTHVFKEVPFTHAYQLMLILLVEKNKDNSLFTPYIGTKFSPSHLI